ncbi:VOC family protein [Ferdinandcohnia sp. Marseille-Q9671]
MQLHHYGFEVRNLVETVDFYKRQFGFEEESRLMFMEEELVFLRLGNFRLELFSGKQVGELHAHICFEVSDLDKIMFQFSNFSIVEGPYQLANGWRTVFYEGTDGHILEFLQLTTP